MDQQLDDAKSHPILVTRTRQRQLSAEKVQTVIAQARRDGLLKTAKLRNLNPRDLFQAVLRADPDLVLYVPTARPMQKKKKPGPPPGYKFKPFDRRNQNLGPILDKEQTQKAADLAAQIGTAAAAAEFNVSAPTLRRAGRRYQVELHSPIGGKAMKARRVA